MLTGETPKPHKGFTLWFTGMSGAGKSTLTGALTQRLREAGYRVEPLDGDEVRTHLSKGLGFSKEDRDTNVARIGFVARLLARNEVIAITAAISPYAAMRDAVRAAHAAEDVAFVEVYAEAALESLAARDPKGLYKKALSGEIPQFTGLSDPYEPPLHPEITVHTDREDIEHSLAQIWSELQRRGLIDG